MQSPNVKSFVELARHIESILKAHEVFFASQDGQDWQPVALASLDLKEVRFLKYGTAGVVLQFQAVLEGAYYHLRTQTDAVLLGELGVYGLALAAGSARHEADTTHVTLTCRVSSAVLCGPLQPEVESLCGNKASQAVAKAVEASRKSADYQAERNRLAHVDREIERLQSARNMLQSRLLTFEVDAQQRVLPVPRSKEGTPLFTVVLT